MTRDHSTRDGTDRLGDSGETNRRGFNRMLLAGAAGAAGLAGMGTAAAEEEPWHDPYFDLTGMAMPSFYRQLPTRDVIEELISIEDEVSPFFDVLGERVDLDQVEIVGGWVRPKPCGGPIPPDWNIPDFQAMLEAIMEDIEDDGLVDCYPTWCEDPRAAFVPTGMFTFRGDDRVGHGFIDPLGTSQGICPPLCFYEGGPCDFDTDSVRWTEDGWLDQEGVSLDRDETVLFDGKPL